MLLQDVRLFVRPSDCHTYSVETAKHVIKLVSLPGSHTILIFSVPNGMAIFRQALTGTKNVIHLSLIVITPNFIEISSVFVAKKCRRWQWIRDSGT